MRFEEFGLGDNVLRAIKDMGYEEPTEIQERCIPLVKDGRDVVAQSQTGSGKTAAFSLPVLEKIVPGRPVQMLVLTPTRELCIQNKDALELYSKYLKIKIVPVYGGVGYEPQIHGMRNSEIVVSTPGRMLDHLAQGNLSLSGVKWLVLDEADKMFEMGFIEDVEKIIGQTPSNRQTLLFSATFSSEIHNLIEKHLKNPIRIIAKIYVPKNKLRQVFYNVDQRDKFSLLVHLLKNKTTGLALVFCATRNEVSLLTKNLYKQGVDVMAIHGGLAQAKRSKALEQLKNAKIDVLVATDVAARGLDIQGITHIYNYDVPKTSVEYIHRIGRTARAGHNGDAVTLLSQRDFENFDRVLQDHSLDLSKAELPEFPRIRFIAREDDDYPARGGFRGRAPRDRGGGEDRGGRSREDRSFGSSGRSRDIGGSRGSQRGSSRGSERGETRRNYSSGSRSPSASGRRDGGFNRSERSFGRSESDFSRGRTEDRGERMIEISGGFGEKPKLVKLSDIKNSNKPASHKKS